MKNQASLSYIRQLIERLSEDELHALYRTVGERLRLLHRTKALFAMRKFQMLDKVYFVHHGQRREGMVTRLNQKTISVTLKTGEHWNVSPDFLTRMDEENPIVELPLADNKEKIGRNDPCWCESGKKYKKCHYPN